MPVDAVADATENLLPASGRQSPTIDSSKAPYDKRPQAIGAAGWHGFDAIETLVGPEGEFLRSEDWDGRTGH